jgi:hypothetical protein
MAAAVGAFVFGAIATIVAPLFIGPLVRWGAAQVMFAVFFFLVFWAFVTGLVMFVCGLCLWLTGRDKRPSATGEPARA